MIPGFVNVDLSNHPHIHYRSGIDNLPFFESNSASLIYCSHALQYFSRADAKVALAEWKRVLRPGGELRLAVPDFLSLLSVYKMSNSLDKILGPLYGFMQVETTQGLTEIYHRTTYDETSLTALLKDVGFLNIGRWDWRQTEHSSIDDHSQAYFPHMAKDDGLLVSLNIKAEKP